MPQLTIDMPSGGITNSMISTSAAVDASKIVSAKAASYQLFAAASTVTALTVEGPIIMGATGGMIKFYATINGTIATGGDRTVTVDLQRSTSGGTFSTMLSSTIGFTSASALRTPAAAVFSTTALAVGDQLRIVVTVAGAAGNQALGLSCSLSYYETYA